MLNPKFLKKHQFKSLYIVPLIANLAIPAAFILQNEWPEHPWVHGGLTLNPWKEVFTKIRWIIIISPIVGWSFSKILQLERMAKYINKFILIFSFAFFETIVLVTLFLAKYNSLFLWFMESNGGGGPVLGYPMVNFPPSFLIDVILVSSLIFLLHYFVIRAHWRAHQ